jgi:hypothetical protein
MRPILILPPPLLAPIVISPASRGGEMEAKARDPAMGTRTHRRSSGSRPAGLWGLRCRRGCCGCLRAM